MRIRVLTLSLTLAFAASALVAVPAQAATPKPSSRACSVDFEGANYACMEVADRTVPSGDTVTFTGQLSPSAMANLKAWTKGDNIVCLDRFKTKPEADGSWPWETLEGVCTTVRKNGGFTLEAEFGRKGTYYYGLEFGPCRASASLCGDGDPGLLGVGGPRVVAVRTT